MRPFTIVVDEQLAGLLTLLVPAENRADAHIVSLGTTSDLPSKRVASVAAVIVVATAKLQRMRILIQSLREMSLGAHILVVAESSLEPAPQLPRLARLGADDLYCLHKFGEPHRCLERIRRVCTEVRPPRVR